MVWEDINIARIALFSEDLKLFILFSLFYFSVLSATYSRVFL